MHAKIAWLTCFGLILGSVLNPAAADDWKPVAKDHGVELAYQSTGNLLRLQFTNTGSQPMIVNWKMRVLLDTGTNVDNQGELNLAAGETERVASAPYRDAGHPAEVKSISGTIAAKQTLP